MCIFFRRSAKRTGSDKADLSERTAEDSLHRLSDAMAKTEGLDVVDVHKKLMGRLSVKLQQGNSSLFLSRLPSSVPGWVADGDVPSQEP